MPSITDTSRQSRLRTAFFRGEALTMADPEYFRMVGTFLSELLRADREPLDITNFALGAGKENAVAHIIANEAGVLAGLEEAAWFFKHFGLSVEVPASAQGAVKDGQILEPGQSVLRLEGNSALLLSLERVGLNLLQRMSGIATAMHALQHRVHAAARASHQAGNSLPQPNVVATRKTPWGLLDKRAAHLGGGGTHRLGLADAILIKTNHLRLFAPHESDAIPLALHRVWRERHRAAFIEVEVTQLDGALAAGRAFRDLRRSNANSHSYPCIIMLDNISAGDAQRFIAALRTENVWDDILIEVSGGISGNTLESYVQLGVDAISIGSLTHSCKALDMRCRLQTQAGTKT